MNDKQKMLKSFIHFILLGFSIAFFIGVLLMFSYLFIWGVIIGSTLWVLAFLKNYFFKSTHNTQTKGRIIEHDKNDKE